MNPRAKLFIFIGALFAIATAVAIGVYIGTIASRNVPPSASELAACGTLFDNTTFGDNVKVSRETFVIACIEAIKAGEWDGKEMGCTALDAVSKQLGQATGNCGEFKQTP